MDYDDKLNKRINIFVLFIFLFPIIIEVFSFLLNNGIKSINLDFLELMKSLISTIKTYITFYGTALSITFTVYSFIKEQKKYDDDRKKEQKKYDDDRKKEELKRQEEQQKANELKEKELEAKRDYFRPTFIIEKDKDDSHEYIKVFMRNENLYLEQVKYYSSSTNFNCIYKQAVKSGETIARKNVESFYITAKTQIGETILFGYFNNGVKIYKYLKNGAGAHIPMFGRTPYNQEIVDNIWGVYNDDIEYSDRSLDQILFYDTVGIRQKLVFNYNNSISETLASKTLEEFFKSVFLEIVNKFDLSHFTSTSVDESIRLILSDLKDSVDFMKVSEEIKNSDDYLFKQLKSISYRKKDWQALFKSNALNIESFLTLAIGTLHYGRFEFDEEERCTNYKALLRILMTVFDYIDIDTSIDYKIYDYKSIIYNKLVFIN
ncbi:hypothetical protein [Streptococcus parasanguinis]|uniref:hypothetical protein n=1 Tax=Streptococcus parasanguinis TaxID=1318 RepID=UPI0039C2BB67